MSKTTQDRAARTPRSRDAVPVNVGDKAKGAAKATQQAPGAPAHSAKVVSALECLKEKVLQLDAEIEGTSAFARVLIKKAAEKDAAVDVEGWANYTENARRRCQGTLKDMAVLIRIIDDDKAFNGYGPEEMLGEHFIRKSLRELH